MRPPPRRQFRLSHLMLAVVLAAFDSLLVLQGVIIFRERGAQVLHYYVGNTLWPTLGVILNALFVYWLLKPSQPSEGG